jgi:hypothetical protein
MSIAEDISAALADAESTFGEEVTIGTWTGTAIVSGGGLNFEAVAGGIYEGSTFSIIVRKSVLPAGFIPEPPMPVSARGYDLRIAPGGITNARAHYKIAVVARDVPS